MPPETTPPPRLWFGQFEVPEHGAARIRVGPRTVWIENRRYEWRVTRDLGREATGSDAAVTLPFPPEEIPPVGPTVELRRFGFSHESTALGVVPRLADRPVVARPDAPFFLPAGEEVTIYVSTALWMQLHVGTPARELLEFPIVRPPDTWFGPSTQVGELCYGSRSTARLSIEEQPLRPERALTAAILRNRQGKPLLVERLNLPVPFLSLYRDRRGLLWTQNVTVEVQPAGVSSEVKLGAGAPPDASDAEFVQGPRVEAERNILLRAFGLLLG